MRRLCLGSLLFVLLGSAAPTPALADTVILRDGGTLVGRVVKTREGGYRVEQALGSVTLAKEEVESVIEAPFAFAPFVAPSPLVQRTTRAAGIFGAPRVIDPAAQPVTFLASRDAVSGAALRIEDLFRRRAPAEAEALVASDPAILTAAEAERVAAIDCTFDGKAASLRITRRPGVTGSFGVALTPGSILRSELDTQDLTLLRAPVVVVAQGETEATVRVPIACGNHGKTSPVYGRPHRIVRDEPGSEAERLLAYLCSGDRPGEEPDAQLAIWAVRNRIATKALEGNEATFATSTPVRSWNAKGAGSLIAAAGLDPNELPMFAAAKTSAAAPPAPSGDRVSMVAR